MKTGQQTNVSQVPFKEEELEILNQNNWLLHKMFLNEDYDGCLHHMNKFATEDCDLSVRVQGFIHRYNGDVVKSLDLFQQSIQNHSRNTETVKHIGKSLYLLGRYIQASRVYENLCELRAKDPDVWFSRGLCYIQSKHYAKALDSFQMANSLEQSARTYLEIAKVHSILGATQQAGDAYVSAMNLCPEDSEILTLLALFHLRNGENYRAFDFLGNALTHDPLNAKTILAAGSIIQDHDDTDVALVKYRVAAHNCPESFQFWNNIGICFLSKKKFVAAMSCLRKAYEINPISWIVCYNLGIIYLRQSLYATSFHYLACAINLNSKHAYTYMLMATVLLRLADAENATLAYEKAIKLDSNDYVLYLNYTICLLKTNQNEKAQEMFTKCCKLWEVQILEEKDNDTEEIIKILKLHFENDLT